MFQNIVGYIYHPILSLESFSQVPSRNPLGILVRITIHTLTDFEIMGIFTLVSVSSQEKVSFHLLSSFMPLSTFYPFLRRSRIFHIKLSLGILDVCNLEILIYPNPTHRDSKKILDSNF